MPENETPLRTRIEKAIIKNLLLILGGIAAGFQGSQNSEYEVVA
jgi:hypothetical protein